MDAAELIGLLGAEPHAALLAVVAGDPTWHIADDWGLGDWTACRVPVGLKFRCATNGLVSQEIVLARAAACDRPRHERQLARTLVPAHLAVVDRPHNRLAPL